MVYNAIGQSAQPILSYNFGAGDAMRVRSAFRLALGTAVTCGLVFFALTALFNHQIVAMFIDRPIQHTILLWRDCLCLRLALFFLL